MSNKVLYLCNADGPTCRKDECYKRGGECRHTTDITHALNPEPRNFVSDKQGNLWENSPKPQEWTDKDRWICTLRWLEATAYSVYNGRESTLEKKATLALGVPLASVAPLSVTKPIGNGTMSFTHSRILRSSNNSLV